MTVHHFRDTEPPVPPAGTEGPRASDTSWGRPAAIWGLCLGLLMLHPYVVVVLVGPGDDRMLDAAAHICTIFAQVVMVGSALILALDARVTGSLMVARIATAATLFAVQDLPWSVLSLVDPSYAPHAYRFTPGHLVTVAVVLVVLVQGARGTRQPRRSPLLLGLFLGLAVLSIRVALVKLDPDPFLTVRSSAGVAEILLIAALSAAVAVQLASSSLPRWASLRFGLALLALVLARLWVTVVEGTTPAPGAVAGTVLFSALLATTALGLLRYSISTTDAQLASLVERTAEAEAGVKHGREVVHNVRATAAGIVAGAHLLASGEVPPGPRRDALEQMVDVEFTRLERSLSSPDRAPVTHLFLDDVIQPLVTAQEATGHHVRWHESGHQTIGRHDALAETISILLTNAALHARGRGTAIVSRELPDRVEISISDRGPGIEQSLRERLFEWGSRGVSSGGEGIGLQRAHRLIQEQGGMLTLERSGAAGTTFVLTLPRVPGAGAPAPSPPSERDGGTGESTGLAG